jgi:20S proteasome subunit alpha 6
LVTLNRSASELSSSQRKLFKVDDFVGIAVSGLTADGTALVKMLRSENISHKFTFGSHVDISRLALKVADNSQVRIIFDFNRSFIVYYLLSILLLQVSTQRAGARPSGVGTLIAGCDESGCHIFQTCPSGSIYEHEAIAIGLVRLTLSKLEAF